MTAILGVSNKTFSKVFRFSPIFVKFAPTALFWSENSESETHTLPRCRISRLTALFSVKHANLVPTPWKRKPLWTDLRLNITILPRNE
ncbi:hypothetical protein [Methylomicrobium lacus]|uniref:hypothetical protein n=1 Tax=Methylomicrobium lacus TaxID=136992 RepID=UPI00126963F6|nr:hypothetical protein [Methylomicrobium lacus]